MTLPKSKPRVVKGAFYEQISNKIHNVKPVFTKPTLAETLHAIAEKENHLPVSDQFVQTLAGSYLQLDRDYYLESPKPGVLGRRMAELTCVCGKKLTLPFLHYIKKHKRSCGCRDENVEKRVAVHKEMVERLPPRMLDLRKSGENGDGVFGFLKVTSYVKYQEKHKWVMQCVCGTHLTLTRHNLGRKKISHCGAPLCTKLYSEGYDRTNAIKFLRQIQELPVTDNQRLVAQRRRLVSRVK